ncbi:DUF6878 family protein [Hyphomicrobium sp.]|jgi:hypothetical protein|uniref:DUF6878 family protein n=1 Tax=Hyphomicrobium sp. TaxID=82 RepID=UPI003564717C
MTSTSNPITKVKERLHRLPAKTAAPFRQLIKTGQVSEGVIDTILDAGELAGDTSKLIGFAAGFLHMTAIGVPIKDTIAMAATLKRRINLNWSPKRWHDEHERLSRATTLKTLADQNVSYDVSAFQRHLPPRFPGYLIRSSRRLGMEGLRQRHCVASYHRHLEARQCAIAAVFVDKQRWTVELQLTSDPEEPIRIQQIKTRCNGHAPASVRQTIHNMLDIALPKTSPAPDRTEERLYKENLRRLLPVLRNAAIESVTVEFDGSGDNGSIQNIDYAPHANRDVCNQHMEYLATEGVFSNGRWMTTVLLREARVDDVIDTVTSDYLDETGVDWCNDDGGFGRLEIDVAAGTVELEVNQRHTESSVEFSSKDDIATGDQIE